MVIEVVTWEGAVKTHAVSQDDPARTLCGRPIPGSTWRRYATTDRHEDEFPTCLTCSLAVMLS